MKVFSLPVPRVVSGVARVALYVEGPLDRDVLRAWAYRISPALLPIFSANTHILGGRQPARAVEHFRRLQASAQGALRALCVLDRDQGAFQAPAPGDAIPGLEFFTWGRRHIESYLLVPAAILRCLRDRRSASRTERVLRAELPTLGDEEALREYDAKRLLGRDGPLARSLDQPLRPGRIARVMRWEEFHADVHEFFRRLETLAGREKPSFFQKPLSP